MNTVELIPHRETPRDDRNSAYEEPSHPWVAVLAWILLLTFAMGVLTLALVDAIHQDVTRERRKQFENREMLRIFEETTRQQREDLATVQASVNDLRQARKKMVDPR
jgi:predicted transglutaminase-like cysteine proteinase